MRTILISNKDTYSLDILNLQSSEKINIWGENLKLILWIWILFIFLTFGTVAFPDVAWPNGALRLAPATSLPAPLSGECVGAFHSHRAKSRGQGMFPSPKTRATLGGLGCPVVSPAEGNQIEALCVQPCHHRCQVVRLGTFKEIRENSIIINWFFLYFRFKIIK
jgi:hypothetical protein